MKILVFENEISEVENSFKIFNLKYYNNELEIKYYTNSQDFGDITNVDDYKLIIIDIDLSVKSAKDGFGIIDDIKEYKPEVLRRTIIITGSSQVRKKLDEKSYNFIPILQKPINYKEIFNGTKKFLT
ncbi:hypothetical protein AMRN_0601 [Malaciobacter marinus]|uniref:Response regulator receiver domain-containing protein n=1 Tax=Malaciobacter marinus TaxID=505249 RepID=A0A347TIE0_9BACT|nr:response regulator [Malaciobacter marinus]AXX86368.1 hypothetical protein AMRN_0601 [Malaciobacter marinus]PHO14401.1 hypothetical protein CPH92_12080 [Malaciobacter marinus]